MKVVNLIEDTEGILGCAFEHGLSFYMETAKHKMLLDFGASKKTIENASKLGINLAEVDIGILSHGHYDHAGGIIPFTNLCPNAVIYMQESASNAYYHLKGDKNYSSVVISGFHMIQKHGYSDMDLENIRCTARELLKTGAVFYTGHCTGKEAIKEMHKIMEGKLKIIHSGMELF